jgi:Ca2+-binding EF-hand superfamily protein
MGEAFARADTNNDGRVTREEGVIWLQARFTEIDANRDGGVTIEEMRAYYEARRPAGRRGPPEGAQQRMQERGAAMFRFVDANGDGRITFEELRPMAEAAFRAADRDGDGALARDELRRRGPEGRGDRPMPGAPAPTPR